MAVLEFYIHSFIMAGHSSNWFQTEIEYLISVWLDETILSILDSRKRNTLAYQKMEDKMVEAGFFHSREEIQVTSLPAELTLMSARVRRIETCYFQGFQLNHTHFGCSSLILVSHWLDVCMGPSLNQ